MKIFQKIWSEFKNIIDNNNMYWDYEDITDKLPEGHPDLTGRDIISTSDGYSTYVKERLIYTIRNQMIAYECLMSDIVETPTEEDNPDQYDFNNNYMSNSGERRYYHDSFLFEAKPGEAEDFYIQCLVEGSATQMFIFKGWLYVDQSVTFGDELVVSIVDHDNVLGAGVDYHLGHLIMGHHLSPYVSLDIVDPPDVDNIASKDKVPSWAYIKAHINFNRYTADDTIADSSTSYPGDGTIPAASEGDKYILASNTDSLHTNWGTITGVGDYDIVEYDGSDWVVVYDASEHCFEFSIGLEGEY